MSDRSNANEPYVSAQENIPEVTIKALLLGAVLAVVMGAANTYLGLKVGMTVSASIPAAVISMALLRGVFRRGTILENNIVQTMASTGESLAAGAIFTIPALVLVGQWQQFKFWPTTLIVLLGGLLGIVFMVPMRRALIVGRPELTYPEGVACSQVLIVGQEGGSGLKVIAAGLGIGALFKFLVSGVHAVKHTVEGAIAFHRSALYLGADLSVALLAVGYIVKLRIASLVFLGGVIGWVAAMPFLSAENPAGTPLEIARDVWSTKIRYMGVGAMLVGGLFSIWQVRGGILAGIVGLGAVAGAGASEERPRTDRDMPLTALLIIFVLTTLATFAFYDYLIGSLPVAAIATVVMIVAAFLFVAVATYIVGLVGSSNSPVSGMTICALLIAAGVLLAFGIKGDSAILATLGIAGVVCCAACTAGDVAQDLKTGLLVGATPVRQQWVEIVGAIIPAFFFAPILSLLHSAYGIGTGGPESLEAPQAALFASLAKGIFGEEGLPWSMVGIGAGIGVALIVVNAILERTHLPFRTHVMPVAVGLYLPLKLGVPIFIGGLLQYSVARRRAAGAASEARDNGVLFGSGLIAGEALMGILLAIPIALGYELTRVDLTRVDWVSLSFFGAVIVVFGWIARRGDSASRGQS